MQRTRRNLLAGAAMVALASLSVLLPSNAFAAEGDKWVDGDTFTQVIFERELGGLSGASWSGTCPSGYPWLDKHVGTAGKSVGQGIRATSRYGLGWVDLVDDRTQRQRVEQYQGRWLIGGTGGRVVNFDFSQTIRLEMVCTRDRNRAWGI